MTVGRYLWTTAAELGAVIVCGLAVYAWVLYMTSNEGLAFGLAGITGLVGGLTSIARVHRAIEHSFDTKDDDDDVGQSRGEQG